VERCVGEDERAVDDDFAVWPFRRQLVDRFARDDETLTAVGAPPFAAPSRPRVENTQPIEFVPLVAPPRPAGPLRLAVPFALAAFCAALAGSAALSGASGVESRLDEPIVQAAAAAAQPVAKPTAKHVSKRAARAKKAKPKRQEQLVRAKAQPKAATPAPPPPPPVARVIVNSVVGLPRAVASRALQAEGLGVRIYGVPSAEPAGAVVAQHPRGGAHADAGSYVRLNVSAR
jgi:hypothetical protein